MKIIKYTDTTPQSRIPKLKIVGEWEITNGKFYIYIYIYACLVLSLL